jgi:hypothetical protein
MNYKHNKKSSTDIGNKTKKNQKTPAGAPTCFGRQDYLRGSNN